MPGKTIVAYLCEGALYCPDHCTPDAEDLETSHVVAITEFCVMIGEGLAATIADNCCSICSAPLTR